VALRLYRTCAVPDDLASVTTARPENEADPRAVGMRREDVDGIWQAVERLYRSGIHPAIQVCIRRHGAIVLDRAIGHAAGNGPDDSAEAEKVLCTPETPFCTLSASKPVTAMLVHLLDQKDYLRVDDPVAEYIPEFGRYGKRGITIRHVLSHRAGLPSVPARARGIELLADPERILDILCEARPQVRAGRQLAYHAVTGGFILAEVVRRASGRSIEDWLDRELRRKLRFRWLRYGVPRREVGRVARSYFTGPPPVPPLSTLLERTIGLPFLQATEMANDPRFLTATVPSGNLVATAEEMSRFYDLLLRGGELGGVRVFEPRTVFRATAEQSYFELDLSLGLPLRYSMGFQLGARWLSLFGPYTPRAFGHVGFTNIVTWADPERGLAAAIMTSGKPLIYAEIYYLIEVLLRINRACA
jgi:CubicO group peptidase (beta-lactamase class C family)